jgi:hypothetical protein
MLVGFQLDSFNIEKKKRIVSYCGREGETIRI